jgi:amino acid transporter
VSRAGLRRELGLVSLLAVVFFNVSGGPYGIEDAVSSFGPGLTLVLLVLTPIIWSLPVSLAMAELAAALPEEGGYVAWVRRAFGPFWGFQVGWWSWINSFVDVAVYPALFADYAKYWWPDMSSGARWAIALVFIWALTALNVAGVRVTGRSAVALSVGALVPVAVFTLLAALHAERAPWMPFAAEGGSLVTGIGLGLAVMMWNYSGWDNPSTLLGEAEQPRSDYRRAMLIAVPLIALAYLLPVAAGLSVSGEWKEWETGHFPEVAEAVGGWALGSFVTAGALLATAGLFLSGLLANSRLPYVLASLGQLPAWLGSVSARTGTPWVAVVLSSVCYSAFAVFSFKELIVLNIWLYSIALMLELAAFVALRYWEPHLPRPWRVGGGRLGMWLVAGLPVALSLLAMATAGWENTVAGVIAALTGPLVYWLVARRASTVRR